MGAEPLNDCIGWDLGGAHIKAAWVREGEIRSVWQVSCPLWKGLDKLDQALRKMLANLPSGCLHAVTMTGEMADLFSDRQQGVDEILKTFVGITQTDPFLYVDKNIIPLSKISFKNKKNLASNNWQISQKWIAHRLSNALLVDIGSTTTDLAPIIDGVPACRGVTDKARLFHGELDYMGVVRTPLMALTREILFTGDWYPLMAEHFSTTADIYRILGELSPHMDQADTPDGGPKTRSASMVRVARVLGADRADAPDDAWWRIAAAFREIQLQRLTLDCLRQLSRFGNRDVTLVGAGAGRFLLPEVARRLEISYLDMARLFPCNEEFGVAFSPADCAPASALALLLDRQIRQ